MDPNTDGTKAIQPEAPKVIWKRRLMRALKWLKIFAICSVILTVLEIGIGYWMVSSRWKIYLTTEEAKELAKEVNEAPPLPDNFKRVYRVFYPEDFYATMAEQIFLNYGYRMIFRDPNIDVRPHCHCYFVYDVQRNLNEKLRNIEWTGRIEELEYGFAMEKYSSPEKCMDYSMAYRIQELKTNYLNPEKFGNLVDKPLGALSDDEIIEVILLLKDKYKYNRFINPKEFNLAFAEYRAKLDSALANTVSVN